MPPGRACPRRRACRAAAQDALAQAAALQDLAALAAPGAAEAWRRRAVFEDETGAAWQAAARACLDEVGRLRALPVQQ
jgi:hypothetical protein